MKILLIHTLVILALTAIGVTVSFLFSFNPFLPLLGGASLIALSLFFQVPIVLLSLLVIIRMSLDYSSQFISLTLYERVLSLSQLIGLGIAALGALLIIFYHKQVSHYPLLLPVGLILIWGITTFPNSLAHGTTLTEIIRVFGLLSIGAMAFVFTKTKKDYVILLGAILLSAALPLFMSLYQFLFGVGFTDADVAVPRIFGTFSHPNILSLYLFAVLVTTTLFFFAPNVITRSVTKRNVSYFLFALFSLFLLLTFTRVAWLTAFIFFAVIFLFRYKVALIPVILFPVLIYALSPAIQERVHDSLSPAPDSSIVWRQNLWHDTILSTVQDDRQFLGYGMGTFPLVSERLRGENVGSHDPHNDLVRFFVEGGYIGLGVYILYALAIGYILLHTALKKDGWLKDSLLIMTLFWACLLLAGLSDNIFKNTPVEWIFFILAGALLKIASQKN